jgi:hypothetical protein
MLLLGDLLAAARDSSAHFEAWLVETDEALARRLREAAAREGLSTGRYIRASVADFARLASEEDWATLMSGIRDSADPGTACLVAMAHWRLTVPTCTHHSAPVIRRT